MANPLEQATQSWTYSGEISYGITDKLALRASIPLLHVDFMEGGSELSDTEIGDLAVVAQYFWSFGYFAAPTMLSLGLGLNVPTGGGIENPITSDRNFVSGTVDPIISGSVLFSIMGSWSVNANLYTRPILDEDNDGTKSGSFISYGIGTSYSIGFSQNSGVDLSLHISGLHREKDKIKGQAFSNSGGDWVYITPGATFSIFGRGIHGVQIWSNLEIPVYQFVNGNQLTEDWTVRMGLGYGFHLLDQSQ